RGARLRAGVPGGAPDRQLRSRRARRGRRRAQAVRVTPVDRSACDSRRYGIAGESHRDVLVHGAWFFVLGPSVVHSVRGPAAVARGPRTKAQGRTRNQAQRTKDERLSAQQIVIRPALAGGAVGEELVQVLHG